MNSDTNNINRASGAAVGFVVACLIFIVLAVIVKFSVSVPAIDADRDTVRAQALFPRCKLPPRRGRARRRPAPA